MNLQNEIDQRKKNGLFRRRQVVSSAQGSLVKIDNKTFINFASNDYLGLANNDVLKACMADAIKQYGIGAGSSQLLVGHFEPHKNLEEKLARFLNRDAALVFPSGYQVNLAIASALIDAKTIVLQDKLNHASLIDAALLSKGKLIRYRHNDVEHLGLLLEKYKQSNLLVMTDGVFSMDGDVAPLSEISELCKTYHAMLIVDDAHGIGVLGESGAGLLEYLELDQTDVPLLIGTFGKSFGASGAFISGSKLNIEMFIQKARTYIYTTALLPAIAATMVEAIDMISNGNALRKNISDLVKCYIGLVGKNNLNKSKSEHHIQPYIIGDNSETLQLSQALYDKDILVPAIRPPTVPVNTSRLRISITATHTKDHLHKLVNVIKSAS